tara:strand:+ start:212 stop:358 length:147 start_codon:yes stop_codon:yes gene_type:complete
MIRTIIGLLQQDDFYLKDPDIDFAKGVQKMPRTIKDGYKIIKRKWKKA